MDCDAETDGNVGLIDTQTNKSSKSSPSAEPVSAGTGQQRETQGQKKKRKHRRGKPKPKNCTLKMKFQIPRIIHNNGGSTRPKLNRSRSLVPYNTNKFLMEEHLAEIPSTLHTSKDRTRDSSFSMDSDDNYFYSLPEDEEEFLTKEFSNVYEKARLERLESLSKQQLIEECLQIEDRYSSDQGVQRQHQLNIQRISAEFLAKIKELEEKIVSLNRENFNLRSQLVPPLVAAASASPPSAAAPIGACQPTPMSSDSESSSSSSTSSSVSSSSDEEEGNNEHQPRVLRRESCSSCSSMSEFMEDDENNPALANCCVVVDNERHQLLDVMEDDGYEDDDADEFFSRNIVNEPSPEVVNENAAESKIDSANDLELPKCD